MVTLYLLFKTMGCNNPSSRANECARIIGISSNYDDPESVITSSVLTSQKIKQLYRSHAIPVELGDDRTLRIPETVMFNGKSYEVKNLTLGPTHKDIPEVKCLVIPRTITHIDIRGFDCSGFKVEDNPVFHEVDSVIFKGKSLICYPSLREADEYDIPEGTHKIAGHAFFRCEYLKHISIPSSVKEIDVDSFMLCKGLQRVNIPDDVRIIGSVLDVDRGVHRKDWLPSVCFRGNEYENLINAWKDCFSEEDCSDDRGTRRTTASNIYSDEDIISAIAHGNGDLLGFGD